MPANGFEDLKKRLEELEGRSLPDIVKRNTSLEQLKNLIAAHFITPETCPQIQPMLAEDIGVPNWDLIERTYGGEWWVVEPKLNGVRMLMFWHKGQIRFQTRGRSLHTQVFSERTGNYPQYFDRYEETMEGTILDGEMVAFRRVPDRKRKLHADNDLQLAMGINGSDPENAIAKQAEIGNARFIAFDIIKCQGVDMTERPLAERQSILGFLCRKKGIDIAPQYRPSSGCSIREIYERLTRDGGEGVMLKDVTSKYEYKRCKTWLKIKRFEEVIGFVERVHKIGGGRIAGKVGSIQFVDEGGNPLAIVGGFSDEDRDAMILPDGTLNPEHKGRKALIRYHVKAIREGAAVHARLVSWLKTEQNKD